MLMTMPKQSAPPKMGSVQIPFPVRGLNLRSSVARMRPDEALILDNWFPGDGGGRVRGGHVSHATGLGSLLGSLMEWAGPSSRKLFAAKATDIYEVTSAGAVGAASLTGLTNAYWQSVNFTTSGGAFLVTANGSDSVRNYNGSSWTTPSITGVTSSTLINVASYKTRLWFVEASSTKAWYLGTSAISGAATSLELGDKFRRGAKLLLIGTVSRDAGDGADDVICFISSRGEIVVYEGSDPADTTNWRLIGVYLAAAPIGNRAMIRIDGDLGLLTERGVVSVRQLMSSGMATAERQAITGNIDQGIVDSFAAYGSNPLWEMVVHPRARQAIINVPTSAGMAKQYVLNTQTGAWCTYSGLNATCWGVLNEALYFGTADGTVYQADRGHQDNGAAIPATLKTSFQSYSRSANVERVTMVRPLFTSSGPVSAAIRINNDYKNAAPSTDDIFPSSASGDAGVWGTGLWGTALWGNKNTPYAEWISAPGLGNVSSIHMVIRPNGAAVKLNAFDVKLEKAMGQGL